MKAAELRKLIGKEIEWQERGRRCSGTVVEVTGRNVRIDFQGSDDWRWVPDMQRLQAVDAIAASQPTGSAE